MPTLFVRRRYTVYCAMNGGDVVEHWLIGQPAVIRGSLSVLAFVGVIVLMGLASATGPRGLLVGYLIFLVVGFAVNRAVQATRAELLRALCRPVEAHVADERALALTSNPAERQLLRQRLDGGHPGDIGEYLVAP